MVGGPDEAIAHLAPALTDLAPPDGWLHCGPAGAGHFVKMVHNGIEYGLMQAYAEGFEIMHASEYDLDEGAIAKLWQQGSVVRSWLLELLGLAFDADPGLTRIRGYVEDSGEGRWTVERGDRHGRARARDRALADDAPALAPGRLVLGQGQRGPAPAVRRPRGAEGVSTNPLRDGMRMSRVPGPCALVIFGASGDLAHRKLLPALYNLALRNMLPPAFALIGVARSDYGGDEGYRKEVRKALEAYSRTQPIDDAVLDTFARGLFYVSGSFDDPETYAELKRRLAQADRERGTRGQRRLLPRHAADGLPARRPRSSARPGCRAAARPRARVVIEKPFGRDVASARELDAVVHSAFRERQVFRIDHYLGKETVQNILVLRFANGIFEPVWNRNFIDHVQITVAESIGVEGRGRFYEEAGAMRDIVQNHLLQVLSFVAMEPPASFDAEAVRDERAKVLATLRQLGTADVVRGQYDAGFSGGNAVPAYREEDGRRPELADRDLRRRAAGRRQLALGRRAVLRAHRQAPRQARDRGRDPVQARAAPAVLLRRGRAARAERARAAHPARRGHRAALRRQGAEHAHADPHRQHGLRLRHGLRDRAGRGVRDAAARRDARRRDELHPHRRRDGGVAHRRPGPRRLAERGRRAAPLRRGQLGPRRRRRSAGADGRRWRRP